MLDIVTFNDMRLRNKSEVIANIDDEIKTLIDNMYEAMIYYNGIGLAAIQVGVSVRLFVAEVPKFDIVIMINPKIIERSSKISNFEEGCLSIPGVLATVTRPKSVIVEYSDINGKIKQLETKGLLATCIQHEFDHLDGVLFIDRLDPDLKMAKIEEYRELKKKYL